MWKFGYLGLKILKMSHLLMIVLFLGGILSSFALIMKLELSNFDDVYMTYRNFSIIGILVVDKLMVANLALLETEKALALGNPVFIHNHYLRLFVVIGQIGLTLVALVLSVLKPGRSKVIPQ